ncbi:MAG: hypothetical protein II685_05765 [Clostridia bacterium]|nr:hypothetical protein [Clostridia bacterium]
MYDNMYNILMQTPVGIKYGTLFFNIDTGTIVGELNILNHREPIKGTIDEFGYCHLTGQIITLMKRIDFQATGRMHNGTLNLSAKGERNIFEITGVPISQKQ